MSQADRYKSQGNAALQAGDYGEAIELYSRAIALEPSCEIYFSNRSAAYAGLGRWREALDDSQEVVTLKPTWAKGWARRGAAFSGLGQHEEARKAYVRAIEMDPSNTQLKEKMEAAAEAAAKDKGKRWEDDLWSDDDDTPAHAPGSAVPNTAGDKRSAPSLENEASGVKRQRLKPNASLLAQLDRSLKDASEDTLRACLGQIAMAEHDLCQRVLHILEGLNAASSEGSDDEDDLGENAPWLQGGASGSQATASASRRRGSDSD